MKLMRWAISIDDGTGKRVACGVEISCPEIFETRKKARGMASTYARDFKPRVERVIIEIPGID